MHRMIVSIETNGDFMRFSWQARNVTRQRLSANLRSKACSCAVWSLCAALTPTFALGDPSPTSRPAAAPATTRPTSPPATQPAITSSPEIEGLLAQFQSDNWRARDQAQDGLAAMAQAVEPRLRQFVGTTANAEARTRAQLVLNQIASLRKLGPTRVSLHLKDATPQVAYAELSRQCGLPIVPRGESLWRRVNQATITLDLTDEPFWAAMRRVSINFGLCAIFTGGDEEPAKITLIGDSGEEMSSPAAFNGSFMVLATKLARRSAFDAAYEGDDKKPAGNSEVALTVWMSFFADPKWRIVAHPEQTTAIDSACDDQGKPLPRIEPMRMEVFKPDNPIWLMRTDIKHVPANCTKLKNVKGNFRIVLLEQSEPIEFPSIMTVHNALRKIGERTVQIKEAVKEGEGYKVRLTIFRNGLSTQDWRQQRESQGVQLLDEKGRSLTHGGFNAEENGDQVDYEFNFFKVDPTGQAVNNAGDPSKLIVQLPLEPREVTVPFEFKELAIQK